MGIDLSLDNNTIYEHKCLENIKQLYKQAGKCDEQQKLKDIIEAAMVSTPKIFINKSHISLRTPSPVNKPSSQKSLCIFTNVVDVKKETSYR